MGLINMLFYGAIIVAFASLCALLVMLFFSQMFRAGKGGQDDAPPQAKPDIQIITDSPKKIVFTQQKYHSHAADEPPDGNGRRQRDIDYQHQTQREQIMAVQSERGDLIEPPSKRQNYTHQGQGMGMPPHPLTSVGPQGSAASLSNDARDNSNAKENAKNPENTPVPTAQHQHQAKAQASLTAQPRPQPG